jgi:hypothetical protein
VGSKGKNIPSTPKPTDIKPEIMRKVFPIFIINFKNQAAKLQDIFKGSIPKSV